MTARALLGRLPSRRPDWSAPDLAVNDLAVASPSPAEPVVIGGAARSGTTLVRVIVDSHPVLACGPESGVLLPEPLKPGKLAEYFSMPAREVTRLAARAPSRAAFADGFFDRYRRRQQATRWADKTPRNVFHLDWIFAAFPRARFVHVVRDGRDVVCSFRTHPRYRMVDGVRVETGIRRPLAECIDRWESSIEAGRTWRGDPRYREVRYEDLVERTEPTVRELLDFLEVPWDDRVLRFHEVASEARDARRFPNNAKATEPVTRDAIGRWREDLTAAESAEVHDRLGPLLTGLGYPLGDAR